MVETPEPGTARTQPVECPECLMGFPEPRALSAHIERHREVKPEVKDPRTGKVNSTPCPQGCGRHFLRPSEYREHVSLCDGSVPLWKPPVSVPHWQGLAKGDPAPVVEGPVRRRRKKKRKERKPMVRCEKCGKEFNDGRGLSGHKRGGTCGSGGAAEKPARKKPTRKAARRAAKAGLGSAVGDVLRKRAETERGKAREHEEKADRLEAMAADLDTLME